MEKEIILKESPKAAKIYEGFCWVSRQGWLFESEERARKHGATHKLCDVCGGIEENEWHSSTCRKCIDVERDGLYNTFPFKKWDRETPLAIYNTDVFFFSEDEVHEYIEEMGISISEIDLVICSPNYMNSVDADFFYEQECFPEDVEIIDNYPEIANALDILDKAVENANKKPVSWSQTKVRTTI